MNNKNYLFLLFLFVLKFILSEESPHTAQELIDKINRDSYTYSYKNIDNINIYESRLSNIKSHNGYFSHISYIESISSNYTLKEFEDELTDLLERKFYYNYFDTSIFIVLIKKNSQVIIIIGYDYKKHLKHDVRIPVFREYIKYELKLDSIDYVFDYTSKQLEKSFDFFDPNIVPGRNYLFAVISLSITVGICIIFFIITFICLFCSNKCKIENNREYAKNAKTLF